MTVQSFGGRSAYRRRGFALVMAICMLALLMTFLIAAQTSVLGSARMVKRSSDRIEKGFLIEEGLVRVSQALASTTQGNGQISVEEKGGSSVQFSYERLAPGAELYTAVPGITKYREGDVIVTMTAEGDSASQQFLINSGGWRSGAIRLQ